MKTTQLIKNLQNLAIDSECIIMRDILDIDISKPIEVNDLLFRKTKRFIGYTTLEELPFEICDSINGFDCYAYKETYTLIGIILLVSNLVKTMHF